jgi:hypothetical protein
MYEVIGKSSGNFLDDRLNHREDQLVAHVKLAW